MYGGAKGGAPMKISEVPLTNEVAEEDAPVLAFLNERPDEVFSDMDEVAGPLGLDPLDAAASLVRLAEEGRPGRDKVSDFLRYRPSNRLLSRAV
jgi:hypothetical protein